MEGLRFIAVALLDTLLSVARYPNQRWEMDCEYCDRRHRARSYNMVLLRNSLHVHFSEDGAHPDGPEEVADGEWHAGTTEPVLVAGESPHAVDEDTGHIMEGQNA